MDDLNSSAIVQTAPRIFNIFLTCLMVFMAIIGIIALLLGLGLMVSGEFYDWVFQNLEVDDLSKAAGSGISRQTLMLSAFTSAIIAAAFFFIARLLKNLLKTLLDGDPFVPENIDRLRKIWIILALTEAFRMVARPMIAVMDPSDTMNFDLDIRFTSWFLVFVIATVAEVFRYGAALRQEQKLTI